MKHAICANGRENQRRDRCDNRNVFSGNRIPESDSLIFFPFTKHVVSPPWLHCAWFWGSNYCWADQVPWLDRWFLGRQDQVSLRIVSLIIVCRQSFFLILATLPLYALQNSVRLLVVPPILNSVVSKSSAYPWIAMSSTENGSRTSIVMVRLTSNSLSYVWVTCQLFSGNLNSFQIADTDRRISTLYDMLDEQDPTNRDAKGLPFTVSLPSSHLR